MDELKNKFDKIQEVISFIEVGSSEKKCGMVFVVRESGLFLSHSSVIKRHRVSTLAPGSSLVSP